MLNLYGRSFTSRLLLGTAQYPSPDIMREAIIDSCCEIVTVSIRRQLMGQSDNVFWQFIKQMDVAVLPNTAGCVSAKEAITTAEMARELFGTSWIKLEVIGDQNSLRPDPFESVIAAKELVRQGFAVFPYCTEDLVVCDRLLAAGCQVLMPWGAPIGTGRGLTNVAGLVELRRRLPDVTLIVDAGIGAPSHAAHAMELGMDAVLLNTAVAKAIDPKGMAKAFYSVIAGGRLGFEAGIMPPRTSATPSTPVVGLPFWHSAP